MDIPLQSKTKPRPKKIPHCLIKLKQSNVRDLPIEIEPTKSSRAKRKTTQTQNPKEQPASKN